ncbi:MAG: hypothetical protein WD709_03975 [Gammaproteobacteria bacterium]
MLTLRPVVYLLTSTVLLTGCSTTVVDEYRENESVSMEAGESIVVLGRRNSSSYETEFDFIDCVGRTLRGRLREINIIPEKSFIDSMYPYFETSTAPMDVQKLDQLMQMPEVARKLNEFQIRYFVWIDGFTETTDSRGAISCSVGPGGGGCFGFATWDDEANYEATIWDFRDMNLDGKISTESSGTSYLPAVLVPIPLLARVQSNACSSMAGQIASFIQ